MKTTPQFNRGLSKIAQTFASRDAMRGQGANDALRSSSEVDRNISDVFLNQAKTRKINDRIDSRPAAKNEFLSGHTGMTMPKLQAALSFIETGQGERPDEYTLGLLNEARRMMGANMAATGDTNASQIMDGMQTGQNMDVVNKAVQGNSNALALSKASPKFNQNANGVVLDNYGGQQTYDPSLIAQVFASKTKGQNSAGGKMPTADIQLVNRLTVPKEQGGVGMDDQEAFAWLQEYKNNPRNAMMNMYAKVSGDNIFRPQNQQLNPQQITQMIQEMAQQFAPNMGGQAPGQPQPMGNDPARIRGLMGQ